MKLAGCFTLLSETNALVRFSGSSYNSLLTGLFSSWIKMHEIICRKSELVLHQALPTA